MSSQPRVHRSAAARPSDSEKEVSAWPAQLYDRYYSEPNKTDTKQMKDSEYPYEYGVQEPRSESSRSDVWNALEVHNAQRADSRLTCKKRPCRLVGPCGNWKPAALLIIDMCVAVNLRSTANQS
ncbi:hypothetical protein MPDQ_002114 [Monascus purpureus]|uniref:Uncharacterized protein n=1 Tax=Monascus purpureus TaxID=5098 RepID=A0A507QQ97_MONPU|nr:hypothetical protein MPDQ_002114 [Monascus purpureus]BDD55566.1 hypothetical protein MAP00_001066 [Monascus purpureus]